MLSFIKKLFGLQKDAPAGELAPYKVDAPVAEVKPEVVVTVTDFPVITTVEGAGVVEAPAKKPRAKAAPKATATKKPRAKKAK